MTFSLEYVSVPNQEEARQYQLWWLLTPSLIEQWHYWCCDFLVEALLRE
jgi:hypothetical protein